jgi:hypothetical protein
LAIHVAERTKLNRLRVPNRVLALEAIADSIELHSAEKRPAADFEHFPPELAGNKQTVAPAS